MTRTAWRSVHPDLRSSRGFLAGAYADWWTRWPDGFDPGAAGVRP